jgi:ABC-type dipeptide/oligopeptide/nickel transport system permease subunit
MAAMAVTFMSVVTAYVIGMFMGYQLGKQWVKRQ